MSGHTIRSGLAAYGRVPRDLLRDPTISPTAKALFALLDDYTDTPTTYVATHLLAEGLAIPTWEVVKALRELDRAGHSLFVDEETGE